MQRLFEADALSLTWLCHFILRRGGLHPPENDLLMYLGGCNPPLRESMVMEWITFKWKNYGKINIL